MNRYRSPINPFTSRGTLLNSYRTPKFSVSRACTCQSSCRYVLNSVARSPIYGCPTFRVYAAGRPAKKSATLLNRSDPLNCALITPLFNCSRLSAIPIFHECRPFTTVKSFVV